MLKVIKDNFGKEFESSKCDFYLCEDTDYVAVCYGTYHVGRFLFEELELTEEEIAKLEKDGEL